MNTKTHDSAGRVLPPSLRVSPNIDVRDQTPEQLAAEYEYWDRVIREASGWGAGISAADRFRRACQSELLRRREAVS